MRNSRPVRRLDGRRLIRLLLATGAGISVLWLLGLVWFLHLASRGATSPSHVDAIVVFTGGPDRVEVALRLLANGTASRLLVSGAGERTEFAALAHRAGLDPAPLEQQITLGHTAHSTRGNALETAAWAHDQGVESLLVVTTWFHMPRALVELRRVMPAVTVAAYPVGRLSAEELTHGSEVRRLIGEYHKYLAALIGLTASPLAIAAWGSERGGTEPDG
jgi:uncharacterized SAM-binding protein YcdF (DUF218 family)